MTMKDKSSSHWRESTRVHHADVSIHTSAVHDHSTAFFSTLLAPWMALSKRYTDRLTDRMTDWRTEETDGLTDWGDRRTDRQTDTDTLSVRRLSVRLVWTYGVLAGQRQTNWSEPQKGWTMLMCSSSPIYGDQSGGGAENSGRMSV